ncbi:hypothetical protein ACFQ0X_01850 [Streptomyces rectiviolaceus]|uniref:Uncharacterized protein n=1 Tax=Streptomyces rectiviolaceus TaxID=332591 RepID=A0ABP6MSR8_9ACTN
MTPTSAKNDDLPVYENLVRERGDVLAESRLVAAQTLQQAAQAVNGFGGFQPSPGPAARPTVPGRPGTGV